MKSIIILVCAFFFSVPFYGQRLYGTITDAKTQEPIEGVNVFIKSIKKGLKDGISGDLLSIDLNDAIINISIVTGKIDIDQDILGSIFSKFCIGK